MSRQPRVATTVVCVVGEEAPALVDAVGAGVNCRAARPDEDSALERAMAAWSEATRAHLPWLLHDADPLADVAEAYRRFYDEGAHGALEVAVAAVTQRWRAGSLNLPDRYLLAAPETLPVTVRHFYLGLVHDWRPARVVPVAADPAAVRAALVGLRAARWWPDLDQLLGDVHHAPDRLRRPPAADPDPGPGPAAVGPAADAR